MALGESDFEDGAGEGQNAVVDVSSSDQEGFDEDGNEHEVAKKKQKSMQKGLIRDESDYDSEDDNDIYGIEEEMGESEMDEP